MKAFITTAWAWLRARGVVAALRSAATTFIVTFVGLIPFSTLLTPSGHVNLTWASSAAIAGLLAAGRTVVAWIDPGNTSFGNGLPGGGN